MTRRDVLHYLAVVALCPVGGFVAFVAYLIIQIGRPELAISALVWVVGYPIGAAVAGVLGIPFLVLQSRRRLNAWAVLPAFILLGAMGGALVYAIFFGKDVLTVAQWNARLTLQYVVMGVGVSLAAWLLAAFGPFRLSGLTHGEVRHAT